MGHKGTGKLFGSFDLICRGYGHYSGDHRNGYAGLSYFIKEIVKQIVVEKHLGGQKIAAGIYLFCKVSYIFPLIFAFGVYLGICGAADAKFRGKTLYISYKLNGIAIVPQGSVLVLSFLWDVASESHNVFYARILK